MATQLPSFDVLMDLAQNHPEKLENIRRSLSEEIIRDASPRIRHRLEGINFKVDMERQRSKNPLQSCIRITALMHDSFNQMREELEILLHSPSPLREINELPPAANSPSALPCKGDSKVIPFSRPNKHPK